VPRGILPRRLAMNEHRDSRRGSAGDPVLSSGIWALSEASRFRPTGSFIVPVGGWERERTVLRGVPGAGWVLYQGPARFVGCPAKGIAAWGFLVDGLTACVPRNSSPSHALDPAQWPTTTRHWHTESSSSVQISFYPPSTHGYRRSRQGESQPWAMSHSSVSCWHTVGSHSQLRHGHSTLSGSDCMFNIHNSLG
jgi:hypothetical protein